MRRRVLSIAVSVFPTGSIYGPLHFAPTRRDALLAALARHGYTAVAMPTAEKLTAKRIGKLVQKTRERARPDDILIVHVLSHGVAAPNGSVQVVGTDGKSGSGTDLFSWLSDATSTGEREDADEEEWAERPGLGPLTLFLVDVCGAGRAARLDWQAGIDDERRRAWVLAGCLPDRPGFNGWFTEAIASVLDDVHSGRLDIHPSLRYVPLPKVAAAVRQVVKQLAADGFGQLVVGTRVDIGAEVELTFFENPGYQSAARHWERDRAGLGGELREFWDTVDDLVDPWHFISRAASDETETGEPVRGLFQGRHREMAALGEWLDGLGSGSLRVVTGSPGAGKSALLGMLVCAAHPALAGRTGHLYASRADEMPSVNADLVAIHARERRLESVIASMARQLELPETRGGWTPEALVLAMTDRESPPMVVLDALDEAVAPSSLVAELLLPLAVARRDDGLPACRLLVGTRPWREFAPLLDQAARSGGVEDLDTVARPELQEDLRRYVAGLLRTHSAYSAPRYRPAREVIAGTVARELAADWPADGRQRWGEFLVAGLYANYLARSSPVADAAAAAAAAAAVPRTLPEVFELDLRERTETWMRPVMATVAFAKGMGMPLDIIASAVPAFTQAEAEPGEDQLRAALEAARFYLRPEMDTDGSILYRLFHQGLADYLRSHPFDAVEAGSSYPAAYEERLFDRLLDTIGDGVSRPRTWSIAHPYLRRHAIAHAAEAGKVDQLLADPEFLVHADPAELSFHLHLAQTPVAARAAAVYRTSLHLHQLTDPDGRRSLLTIDAARHNIPDLVDRLLHPVGAAQLPWSPRWVTGAQVSVAVRHVLAGHAAAVEAVACTTVEGREVAVTGDNDGEIRVWDLVSAKCISMLTGHSGAVRMVACTVLHGRAVALTSSNDGTTRLWDLAAGRQTAILTDTADVIAGACTAVEGRPVAVTGGTDGMVRVWDLHGGTEAAALVGHIGPVLAVDCSVVHGRPVAVTGGHDHAVRVWDLATRRQRATLTGHSREVLDVACFIAGGHPIAVSTSSYADHPRVWDLATGTEAASLSGHTDAVWGVACTAVGKRPVAVTSSGDRTVRVWDLRTGAELTTLTGHTGPVYAVACTAVEGRGMAVSGDMDGTVRVWDLPAALRAGLTGAGSWDYSMACCAINGRRLAVAGDEDGEVRVWDMTAGTAIARFSAHSGCVRGLACTTIGKAQIAVTGGYEGLDRGIIRVWDIATGSCIRTITDHPSMVWALDCTTLSGRKVVVAGGSNTASIWDLSTGKEIGIPVRTQKRVGAVACTEIDGRPVAVLGCDDGMVRLWDLATATVTATFTGHAGSIDAAACTLMDGIPVAVTAGDGTAFVWDLTTGHCTATLTGIPDDGLRAVACTVLEGRHVAVTGSAFQEVRVWDLATGSCEAVILLPDEVSALAVDPSGGIAVAFGWEIAVLEWTGHTKRALT
jgi:WD40 repeat protein